MAFSSTSYINQGDSLGLRVMIAAYDSSEAMELKYWVDDTAQLSKSESERDLDKMETFKGRAGQSVGITGSVGDHILAGFIAVKEKGVEALELVLSIVQDKYSITRYGFVRKLVGNLEKHDHDPIYEAIMEEKTGVAKLKVPFKNITNVKVPYRPS